MSANKFRVFVFVVLATAVWASGVFPAIIPAAVPTAFKQGNSAKFQLAGTVAGTGATLCTDASGNTTTSGCSAGGGTVNPGTQFQVAEYIGAGTTTAVDGVSIPTCLDTGGNHMNFNASTGVFTCGNTSSGGNALTAPVQADWTGFNTSGMSQAITYGTSRFEFASNTTANNNIQGISHALPSVPYTATFRVWPFVPSKSYGSVSVGWSDGTKYKVCSIAGNSGSALPAVVGPPGIGTGNYSDTSTFASSDPLSSGLTGFVVVPGGSPVWFKLADNNTNWTCSFSFDGTNYLQMSTITRNSFLTATQLVVTANSGNSSLVSKVVFDSYAQ